ncbi:MAG: hypothetical protein WDO16_05030 [Bacteroidota bacterium]
MQFGSGPKTAFCFHGYGEEASSFSFLEKYAGDQYSFFAIDLPFHGQTIWNEGLNCTTSDIMQIITEIIQGKAINDQEIANNLHLLVSAWEEEWL